MFLKMIKLLNLGALNFNNKDILIQCK